MTTPQIPETARTTAPTEKQFRCVSWNLFGGPAEDEAADKRLGDQLALLAGLGPDLVCLQECVDWNSDLGRRLTFALEVLHLRVVEMARSRVGDGHNFTTMLYNSDRFTLVSVEKRGPQVMHHALIRATLRPVGAADGSRDILALGTHLSPCHGDARLAEVRMWATDHGGAFPGQPSRAVLLGDLNTPDRRVPWWSRQWRNVPRNLHARYRTVRRGGAFGGSDRRAVRVLLESGWTDPERALGIRRRPSVGYYYPNEPMPWSLDYVLTAGDLRPTSYITHDTPQARALSDHLPVVCDITAP